MSNSRQTERRPASSSGLSFLIASVLLSCAYAAHGRLVTYTLDDLAWSVVEPAELDLLQYRSDAGASDAQVADSKRVGAVQVPHSPCANADFFPLEAGVSSTASIHATSGLRPLSHC